MSGFFGPRGGSAPSPPWSQLVVNPPFASDANGFYPCPTQGTPIPGGTISAHHGSAFMIIGSRLQFSSSPATFGVYLQLYNVGDPQPALGSSALLATATGSNVTNNEFLLLDLLIAYDGTQTTYFGNNIICSGAGNFISVFGGLGGGYPITPDWTRDVIALVTVATQNITGSTQQTDSGLFIYPG